MVTRRAFQLGGLSAAGLAVLGGRVPAFATRVQTLTPKPGQAQLLEGTGHFRVPVEGGMEIFRALRGRTSGLACTARRYSPSSRGARFTFGAPRCERCCGPRSAVP